MEKPFPWHPGGYLTWLDYVSTLREEHDTLKEDTKCKHNIVFPAYLCNCKMHTYPATWHTPAQWPLNPSHAARTARPSAGGGLPINTDSHPAPRWLPTATTALPPTRAVQGARAPAWPQHTTQLRAARTTWAGKLCAPPARRRTPSSVARAAATPTSPAHKRYRRCAIAVQ